MNKTEKRREYMRELMACKRARARGLNINLAKRLFTEMQARGYGADVARAGVFMAARAGAFGFLNAWER